MLDPDNLGPALPVLRPRRVWTRVVALVMGLAMIVFPFNWAFSPGFVDERCPSPLVRDDTYTCIGRDRLVIFANDGQDRTSVVAAITPFGGQIDSDFLRGIYGVRFPVATFADLARIRLALMAAGFEVSYEFHNGELFALR
jgi:hypothetical protein